MRVDNDFLDFCIKEINKGDKGYNDIISKIQRQNKKEKLKNKLECYIKINEKKESIQILTMVLTVMSLLIASLSITTLAKFEINKKIDARMNKTIEQYKRENQEAQNIIEAIENGNEMEKVFTVAKYNYDNDCWEWTATQSEIDYYKERINDNNEWINQEELTQIQQYSSPIKWFGIYFLVFLIPILIRFAFIVNEEKKYKNIIKIFETYDF